LVEILIETTQGAIGVGLFVKMNWRRKALDLINSDCNNAKACRRRWGEFLVISDELKYDPCRLMYKWYSEALGRCYCPLWKAGLWESKKTIRWISYNKF